MSNIYNTIYNNTKSLSSRKYKKVTHCIFDMDGTIVDSEKLYHIIVGRLCEKYGGTYSKEIELSLLGCTDKMVSKTVVSKLELSITAADFERELIDVCKRELPGSPLKKGVKRLMYHLHRNNIPIALASNTVTESAVLYAKDKPKLFGLLHHKVCVDDPEVFREKPNPDIYLLVAGRFPENPKPHKCLVFEDTECGVEAGINAGMQVVMTPSPRLDVKCTKQATIVLPSLLDFKPELFGLPPFPTKQGKRFSNGIPSISTKNYEELLGLHKCYCVI